MRERREDIPALVEHFLALYRERFGRPALALTEEARRRLSAHGWQGKVRELRNTLERAAALSTTDTIEADQVLGDAVRGSAVGASGVSSDASQPLAQTNTQPLRLEEIERRHILHVLDNMGGNRERAAAILGISSRTLYRKLREYGEAYE